MSVIAEPVTRVRAIGPVAPAPDKGGESRRWIALVFIALAQLMVVLDSSSPLCNANGEVGGPPGPQLLQ